MRFPAQYTLLPSPQGKGEKEKTMEEFAMVTMDDLVDVGCYTTLPTETEEDKINVFNVSSNPDEKLKDHINEVVKIRHVYIEPVSVTNKETGEVTTAPHIVLIDDSGTSYECTSYGIFNCLRKIFQAFGLPDTWEFARPFMVKQISRGADKNFLTLKAVAQETTKAKK